MARKQRPQLPDSMLSLTEEILVPALPAGDLSRLASLADASPEEFQAAMADMLQKLAIEGFRTVQAPRNLRELQTVVDLWRKLKGLDKQDKGSGLPPGLVGVMRGVSRRTVVEVEPVEPGEPGDPCEPVFE